VEDARYPCQSSQLNNDSSISSHVTCAYKHQMPFLSGFVGQHAESSRVFRYIADAPTTTTQRLKAMTSGSLPIFFDISNAFAASSMDEDNLIDQFRAAGKKMIFMGDSTWTGLYPTQFHDSHPFPCYNIMDLHSVDDGIEELLPGMIQRGDWDVLVAHYLGVDHAGHAHGVDSEPMMKKLRQIDSSIQKTVDSIKAQAHKGGLYEDTLVLVAGDHGQTLTGDHGGGSPEEVDSVLVAIDVNNLHTSRESNHYVECQKTCSCGQDRNQCVPDLMQIDLVPTLAAFMNIPIPFVNLGKVSKDLWSLVRYKPLVSPFLDILKANADQVYRYLVTYQSQKGGSGLPESTMATLRRAYKSLEENEKSYLDFLRSTESFARSVWTQFHEGWMILGVAVMFSVVIFQLCLLYHFFVATAYDAKHDTSTNRKYFLRSVGVWLLNMVHPIGIFSFFFLLSEGAHVSMLVACMIVLTTCLQNSKAGLIESSRNLIVSIFCCYLISTLGLQSHSGFGFWQRLTVHDSEQTSHDGLANSLAMDKLNDIIPFKIDPDTLHFAVHYFLPTLVLAMIVDQSIKTDVHRGGRSCIATR
jgi:phosphatidylinositol glycan class O